MNFKISNNIILYNYLDFIELLIDYYFYFMIICAREMCKNIEVFNLQNMFVNINLNYCEFISMVQ